jgi:hypothetical protein
MDPVVCEKIHQPDTTDSAGWTSVHGDVERGRHVVIVCDQQIEGRSLRRRWQNSRCRRRRDGGAWDPSGKICRTVILEIDGRERPDLTGSAVRGLRELAPIHMIAWCDTEAEALSVLIQARDHVHSAVI